MNSLSSTGVVNQYELGENEESPAGDKSSTKSNNGPEHTSASNNQKEVKSVSRLILIRTPVAESKMYLSVNKGYLIDEVGTTIR